LMSPFHQLGVMGVLGGSFLAAMHGSIVTSTVIRKKLNQKAPTYSFETAQTYMRKSWRFSFPNSRSLHFFLAALPVAGIWSAALGVDIAAFDFEKLNFNQSTLYSQGKVVPTWMDAIEQANFGLRILQETPVEDFPLDLVSTEELPLFPDTNMN
jgi:photosystem II P680 reaction center D1 protein